MREDENIRTGLKIGCTTQKLLLYPALLLLSVLGTLSPAFTQDSEKTIPELWDDFHASPEDTTQILALAELGYIYLRANPDSALLLSEEAYQRAQNLNYDSGIAAASISLAEAFALRGMQDSALVYYNRGVNLYVQLKNTPGMSRSYNTRGLFHFSTGRLKKSEQDLDKALLIERSRKNPIMIAKVLHNLGRVYAMQNNIKEALTCYLDARNLKDSLVNLDNPLMNDQDRANTLINLGALYQQLNQYKDASLCYQEALDIFADGPPYPRMIILYNLGTLDELQGKLSEGLAKLEESLDIAQELNAVPNQPYMYDAIGTVYRKQERLELAEEYFDIALTMLDTAVENLPLKVAVLNNVGQLLLDKEKYLEARGVGQQALFLADSVASIQGMLDAHKVISEAAIALDDPVMASYHQARYIEWKDTIDREAHNMELLGIQAQKDVELEQARGELNLAREKQRITSRWNTFLVVALATIVGLLVTVLVLYFRSRSLNRSLESAYSALGEQNVKVVSINQKLEIANNKLQQFAFAAGHDLKESLRNITSFTQLASREIPGDSMAKEHLQIATQGGKRMKKMLEDLLNYSKVDVTETENHWIPLTEVVTSVKNLLQDDINSTKGDIHQQVNIRLKADRIAMEQLFFNLLHNGLKYHQEGVPPRVSINCEERPEGLVFLIRDNGIGIDQDYLESIFEPFARLHNRDLSGSGLGLAICKRVVQSYGGRIWVERQEEEKSGSVFAFTIPHASPQLLADSLA